MGMDGAQHLMCIAALKKLCNHPGLIYNAARQAQDTIHDQEQNEVLLKTHFW